MFHSVIAAVVRYATHRRNIDRSNAGGVAGIANSNGIFNWSTCS